MTFFFRKTICKSAGSTEYTDCISAEELNSSNERPGYDTKWSDGEAPVMLELLGMQSTPLLSSLPGPLWPGVVAPDRILYIGHTVYSCLTELFEIEIFLWFKLRTYGKLNCLN